MMEKAKFTRRRKAVLLVMLLAFAYVSFYVALVKSPNGPGSPWLTVAGPTSLLVPVRNYNSITEAIYWASPGEGIVVFPDYNSNNEPRFPIVVDKRVTIIAKGAVEVMVPGISGTYGSYGFHVKADGVTIEGFEIKPKGDNYPLEAGIYLDHVQDCKIKYNEVTKRRQAQQVFQFLYGIELRFAHENTVEDNELRDNLWGGIALWNSDSNTIKLNEVRGPLDRPAISIDRSDGNTVEDNNLEDEGIVLSYSHGNVVRGNEIKSAGIRLEYSDGNTIGNNRMKESRGGGIGLSFSDGNTIEQNIIERAVDGSGIGLANSTHNFVKGNKVKDTAGGMGMGIWLQRSSNYNVIKGNTVTGSALHNIFIMDSSYNEVKDNHVESAGYRPFWGGVGICIAPVYDTWADNNIVDGNIALNNSYYGIAIFLKGGIGFPGGRGNTITNNIALDNGSYDLVGWSTSSTTNDWSTNYYKTWNGLY